MMEEEINTNDLSKSLHDDALRPVKPSSFEFNRDAQIPRERPSLFSAILQTENPIVSAFSYMKSQAEINEIEPLEGYNWRDGIPVDLQDQSWQYVGADSPLKAAQVTNRIRNSQAARSVIAERPIAAFGMSILAAPFDPSNYFPTSQVFKGFSRGANAFKAAKATALSNMASTIPLEAVLLSTQFDRDYKEAASNFIGAGVVGFALGGAFGAVSPKVAKNAKYDVVDAALDGLGEPKTRPINEFTTKSEAVDMMTSAETKTYERQTTQESVLSAKESNITLDDVTAQRNAEAKAKGKDNLYFDMSREEIVESIKATDNAINAHNLVSTFARKDLELKARTPEVGFLERARSFITRAETPEPTFTSKIFLPKSATKLSTLYDKLSIKELVDLAIKSDIELNALKAHADEVYGAMTGAQASLIAKETNAAAYARMSRAQAIKYASGIPEISKYSSLRNLETVTPKEEKTSVGASETPSKMAELKAQGELEKADLRSEAEILKGEELAGLGKYTLKATSFISPRNAMMNSKNPFVRQLADMFFESNWVKNKFDPEGANIARDISVETAMKVAFGKIERVMKDYMDIFYEQAGIGKVGLFKPERALASKTGLSLEKFGIEVSNALRNGDLSDNPHVQRAAQLMRKDGFEPLKKAAIEQGLLPENVSVETADSYLSKLYNTQLIKENQGSFAALIAPWFKDKNNELKAIQPMIQAKQAEIDGYKAELKKSPERKNKIKFLREQIAKERTKPASKEKKARIEELRKEIEAAKQESAANNPKELKALIKELEQELSDSIPKDLKDSDGNVRKVITDDEQMDAVVQQTIDNVLGRGQDKLANPLAGRVGKSGKVNAFKNRVWLIPDEIVEEFLINDPLSIIENYAKQMIPELELNKVAKNIFSEKRINQKLNALKSRLRTALEKEGNELEVNLIQESITKEEARISDIRKSIQENPENPTIDQAISQVMKEASEYREKLKADAIDAKEAAAIEKQFDTDEANILDSIEILRGVYKGGSNTLNGTAGTVLRNIKKWNYLRYMGYMVISSLPDLAMHVLRHGPVAFAQEGLAPMMQKISGLKNLQHNMDMLKDLGRCMETCMGQRLKAFVDGEAVTVQPGRITKTFDYLSNRFGNASLFNQWQDQMQFIAGNMSISRTLRNIDGWAKTGKMAKEDALRLNALGLGQEHWANIHEQWKQHGGIENGSYWADYGAWNLDSAANADTFNVFKASIINEIDSTNVRVGMGDKPRLAYDPAFGLIMQFRQFMLASTNTVLTSGLSRNDQNFYMGLISLVGMGGLAYTISSKLKNPEKEVDLSPGVFLFNAVDRSGAGGVFMEGLNIGHKMLPIGGQVTRYQQRSKLGNLLGPTAQSIDDIAYVLNAAQNSLSPDGETLSTKDIQKTKTLAPTQNLFYTDYATKVLLNKIAVSLGAEEA